MELEIQPNMHLPFSFPVTWFKACSQPVVEEQGRFIAGIHDHTHFTDSRVPETGCRMLHQRFPSPNTGKIHEFRGQILRIYSETEAFESPPTNLIILSLILQEMFSLWDFCFLRAGVRPSCALSNYCHRWQLSPVDQLLLPSL